MVTAKLYKSGDSYIVTVPDDEVERIGMKEGQLVRLEVSPIEAQPRLADDLREAFEIEFARGEEGLRYLAHTHFV